MKSITLFLTDLNDENETEKDALSKIQAAIEELQQKTSIERDNDIRVLKREIAVLNSNIEETIQKHVDNFDAAFKKSKRTQQIYMRIIIWLLIIIIFLLILSYIPLPF